ncbi:vWA domain-containing protein [Methylocapsa acidiphila]|uniref:vWA domain-containing protein n=1 Tax=Methylocapsa acidiphila TaxID=133552 RepID=UPI00040FC949|nr:vWA domain-containing protein [Methylocapsa acidiphila]
MKFLPTAIPALHDLRFQLTAAAAFLLCLAMVLPPLHLQRQTFDLLAVVDITGSMNTRDYQLRGEAVSRLAMVKDTLRHMLVGLPCQSRMGLAIFAERRPFLLFEPTEICDNFETLDREIAALDWRMGWEGESHIASGFFRSVALADELGADLIFMSDGQEAPPLPWTGGPQFEGKAGQVKGLVIGVGGYDLSPIPKFDEFGQETGFWRPSDVPNENMSAPPPPGAEEREGFNPRNAPFGGTAAGGHEYLSAVDEAHLKDLAAETGLRYAHLESVPSLMTALDAAVAQRPAYVAVGVAWIPAGLSLALLVTVYGLLPLLDRRAAGLLIQPRKDRRQRAGAAARRPDAPSGGKGRGRLAGAAAIAFVLCLAPRSAHADSSDELARGAYLSKITGCVGCHSPRTESGDLIVTRLMTGGDHPIAAGALGRIFPPNITPDPITGIGNWSVDDIVGALKEGRAPDGRILSSAMPWRSQFNQLDVADARAIAVYIKSLSPVVNRVPSPIRTIDRPSHEVWPPAPEQGMGQQ